MSYSMVNYALRVLAPVLKGEAASVKVKFDAEKRHVSHMQDEPRKRVWSAGCKSVRYFKHYLKSSLQLLMNYVVVYQR
jgi:hypothetical protein